MGDDHMPGHFVKVSLASDCPSVGFLAMKER